MSVVVVEGNNYNPSLSDSSLSLSLSTSISLSLFFRLPSSLATLSFPSTTTLDKKDNWNMPKIQLSLCDDDVMPKAFASVATKLSVFCIFLTIFAAPSHPPPPTPSSARKGHNRALLRSREIVTRWKDKINKKRKKGSTITLPTLMKDPRCVSFLQAAVVTSIYRPSPSVICPWSSSYNISKTPFAIAFHFPTPCEEKSFELMWSCPCAWDWSETEKPLSGRSVSPPFLSCHCLMFWSKFFPLLNLN